MSITYIIILSYTSSNIFIGTHQSKKFSNIESKQHVIPWDFIHMVYRTAVDKRDRSTSKAV